MALPIKNTSIEGINSLIDVYRSRAAETGDRVAFTFLDDEAAGGLGGVAAGGPSGVAAGGPSGQAETNRTYAQIDLQARAIAARLQQMGAQGRRALLMYDPGLDYVAAFAGCLYAGVIAVPLYPPDPFRAHRTLPRIQAVTQDCQATLLLSTSEVLSWAEGLFQKLPGIENISATDPWIEGRAGEERALQWRAPKLDRRSLAFLQYTSGSTGDPKGVMVSHGNLLANVEQLDKMLDCDDAVVVSWLPMYHDMGLIGSVLTAWYSGRRSILMSPLKFFQQPIRWLSAISQFSGTTSAAPNFAYDLCLRKIKPAQREGLDLSAWKVAINGAEPVRRETMQRFTEAFAPYGFRPQSCLPCYGLAEATLAVAGGSLEQRPRTRTCDAAALERNEVVPPQANIREVVGCGTAAHKQQIIIVDPHTLEKRVANQVGEIWLGGPNVAQGYWGRSELSEQTFRATTRDGQGPFLRTGDLGFLDQNGELFITGRLKDVVIIWGRNHYPQDIEQTVEGCHEALKPYGGAVFSQTSNGPHNNRERIVAVHELTRPRFVDAEAIAKQIRDEVLKEHQIPLDNVVLIRAGSIPKTSSGKIQRYACRQKYLANQLPVIVEWRAEEHRRDISHQPPVPYVAPRTPTEKQIAEVWRQVLAVEKVGLHDNFFDLGGHSVLAGQLAARLAPHFRGELSLERLFEKPTVAELARLLDGAGPSNDPPPTDAPAFDVETQTLHEMLETIEAMSEEQAVARMSQDQTSKEMFAQVSDQPLEKANESESPQNNTKANLESSPLEKPSGAHRVAKRGSQPMVRNDYYDHSRKTNGCQNSQANGHQNGQANGHQNGSVDRRLERQNGCPAEHHDYLIIGAGPAGLQLGYHLQQGGEDYKILEVGAQPGTFFQQYPRHRKLISINKVYTGYDDPDLNMRWDWNSLLSENNDFLFKDFSKEYFPSADKMVEYLTQYAAHFKLNVQFDTEVIHVVKQGGQPTGQFVLTDQKGRRYTSKALIVAAGCRKTYIPNIPGIEQAEDYANVSVNAEDFVGQRVLILGKGNSAFETADALVGTTALIHVCSPKPVKMAWKTHFVGHLRAINNNFFDTYLLKMQNAVLDATVTRIRRREDGKLAVVFDYAHASGEIEELIYDRIITCTGFRFDDSMFDSSCRPEMVIDDRFPAQTSEWESTNVPGLFFAGTLMQMRDFKKKQSGFIHGFRYNVHLLSRVLQQKYEGRPLSHEILQSCPAAVAHHMIERININSALWQQTGFLCDVLVVDDEVGGAERQREEVAQNHDSGHQTIQPGQLRYYEDLSCDYVHDHWFGACEQYYTITMEFGQERINAAPDIFSIERIHKDDADRAASSTAIHPIIRRYCRGELLYEHHIIEDLASEWKEDVHINPLIKFLEREFSTLKAPSASIPHLPNTDVLHHNTTAGV